MYNFRLTLLLRIALGVWLARWAYPKGIEFNDYCHQIAESLSQPSIMFKVSYHLSHLHLNHIYLSPVPGTP